MFSSTRVFLRIGTNLFWNISLILFYLLIFQFVLTQNIISQQYGQSFYSPQQNSNYLRNSSAFRQEIARFEITVTREGRKPMSISQVPRVNKDDIIKVRLLEESVNGIKPDQSFYDWTLLVAFINPNRKMTTEEDSPREKGNQNSVSQELQFRKKGWYKEHSFTVPYDSQPLFFLYPRPNYRDKLLKLINQNYNEIKKIGDKTIELAGAYAQISSFLNNLQGVLSGNSYNSTGYGNSYGNYGSYGSYNSYGSYYNYNNNNYGYNYNQFMAQTVEMLAKSFNIQLPSNCWQNGLYNNPNSYNSYQYGANNLFNYGINQELFSRVQCIAKNVRMEDFDFSVSRLLQQGGVVAAAQLVQKYPQFIYWINLAAAAVDMIVKITRKAPLKIVPTLASSSDNPNTGTYGGGYSNSYTTSYAGSSSYNPNSPNSTNQPLPKISIFAENQPDDNQFVTAYPIVLHKWQAEADPEVISLRPPKLMQPCLQAGVNILKSTDLGDEQLNDNFTRDYLLTMSSSNGFKKQFPLKKNIGLGGWELNITPQELQEFPKIQMNLESVISGTRGFNELKSPPFFLPVSIGGSWQISPESLQNFTVGGKRTITIRNTLGNCQCLQAVIYKPSFGGQFVFEATDKTKGLNFSPDGKEVSFEVDAGNFQPGQGEIELRTFGGETAKLPLKLYPLPPNISGLKLGKGDREAIIIGERLEQITALSINGRRAMVVSSPNSPSWQSSQSYGNPNQPSYSNQSNPPSTYLNIPSQNQTSYANQSNYGNQPNSVTSNPANQVNSYIPNLQASSANERVVVFENANQKITENTANIELVLEDNRTFPIKQTFPVSPARPTIVANELKEIEAVAITDEVGRMKDEVVVENSMVMVRGSKAKDQRPKTKDPSSTIDLSKLAVFPIETKEISFNVENALTDHDFRVENISVETRLEKPNNNNVQSSSYASSNSYGNETALPKVEFEVLDWKNLRITFQISEQLQKLLGGRRLQFRIRDKERGASDWYSIKQTFVRMPEISSITCTAEMNGMCEMKGASIDYIAQVSIDGGQNWYPKEPATLQVQPTQDGQKLAMIPLLNNRNMLMIKLRDFPKGEGLFINGFKYSQVLKNQPSNKSKK